MNVNSKGAPTPTNLHDHRNDCNNESNIQNKDSHNLNFYNLNFNGPVWIINNNVPRGTNTSRSQTAQGTGLNYSQKSPDDTPSKSDTSYSSSTGEPHNDDAPAPSNSTGDHGSIVGIVCRDENRPDQDEEWQVVVGERPSLDSDEEWQVVTGEYQGQDLDDIAGDTSHPRSISRPDRPWYFFLSS